MAILSGKAALVTGATRGLGRELALALAQAGADVAVLGRGAENGAATAAAIQDMGRKSLALNADVCDDAALKDAAKMAATAFGKIDILVCAAGVGLPKMPVWESTAQDYRTCFDVNVLGVLNALSAIMPYMVARKSGRVVAIGGTYGHKGVAGFSLYGASKWALRGLMKSAALDAAPYGITVNTIAPGGVAGERLSAQFARRAQLDSVTEQEVLDRFLSGTALKRLITPEEIAGVLLHLVSKGGANITGQDIIIDAGTII